MNKWETSLVIILALVTMVSAVNGQALEIHRQSLQSTNQLPNRWTNVLNISTDSVPALSNNNIGGIVITDDGRAIMTILATDQINILSADKTTISILTVPHQDGGLGRFIAYHNHVIFFVTGGGNFWGGGFFVYAYDENNKNYRQIAESKNNSYSGISVNDHWIVLSTDDACGMGYALEIYNFSTDINNIVFQKAYAKEPCYPSGQTIIPVDSYYIGASGDLGQGYWSKTNLINNRILTIRGNFYTDYVPSSGGLYDIDLLSDSISIRDQSSVNGLLSEHPIDSLYDPYTTDLYYSRGQDPKIFKINTSSWTATQFAINFDYLWTITTGELITSHIYYPFAGYSNISREKLHIYDKSSGNYVEYSTNTVPALISNQVTGVGYKDVTDEIYVSTDSGLSILYSSSSPYLDLPVSYSNFAQAAKGNLNGKGPGRVNSWFDHQLPNYGKDHEITTWNGISKTYLPGPANDPDIYCELGVTCYAGHNGIDFANTTNNEEVYTAAPGTVFKTFTTCVEGVSGKTCGGGYGNQVWVDHGQGYATRYGHLKSVLVSPNDFIFLPSISPIGIMGNTGNSTGTHLHFGVYFDKNNDGNWTEDEVVDPFGWVSPNIDPWNTAGNITSLYLWKYPIWTQQVIGNTGASITTPSGNAIVTVPQGALTSPITLQLWDVSPVANASAQLRSSGQSFWLRVMEWSVTGLENDFKAIAAPLSFGQPITVSQTYADSEVAHLDMNQLAIYRWDETINMWVALPSVVDANQHTVSAQTSEMGNYDLQAPLICKSDSQEPDDNFYAASMLMPNNLPIRQSFDITQDEDWFSLDTIAGARYDINTSNLANGVDTVLEIFDQDGHTALVSDDNSGDKLSSSIDWRAPLSGTYFLRVTQGKGSAHGCDAIYDISASQEIQIFIPVVRK